MKGPDFDREHLAKILGVVTTIAASCAAIFSRYGRTFLEAWRDVREARQISRERRRAIDLDDTRAEISSIAAQRDAVVRMRKDLDEAVLRQIQGLRESLADTQRENEALRKRIETLEEQVERLHGVDRDNVALRAELARLKGAA